MAQTHDYENKASRENHWETVSYVLQRAHLFIMKPRNMANDLLSLGFSENKMQLLVKQWANALKPVLCRLDSKTGEINELKNLSWQLEVDLVSSGANKRLRTKVPIGTINLETSSDTQSLQLDHQILLQLFEALEEMQQPVT